MTIIIQSEKVGEYIIEIRQEGASYKVIACKMQDEYRCGYPIDSRIYTTKSGAKRRYNTLKRRYKE